jgi:hypothetical protein
MDDDGGGMAASLAIDPGGDIRLRSSDGTRGVFVV